MDAFIVDDEDLSRDLIRDIIRENCPDIRIAGESSSIRDALDIIRETKPELLFLDIEMPGGSGFDLIEQLQHETCTQVVFVTAHERYTREAIKAGVFDYLLKPLDAEEIKATIQRLKVMRRQKLKTDAPDESMLYKKIILPNHKGFRLISMKEIILLQADNNYTIIHLTENRREVSSQTIGKFEEGLHSGWFLRVHRSYIVNLHHFHEYLSADGGYAIMSNNMKVSVSQNRNHTLEKALRSLGKKIA